MRSRFESSTPIRLVVATMLVLSQAAAQVNQIDKAEQIRVKKLIEQVRPAGEHSGPKATDEQIKALSVETVPVLIDFALNQELPYDFRERAFAFLKTVADERILNAFTGYYLKCLQHPERPCEFADRIWETSAAYYLRTKDERALAVFVEMLTSEKWPATWKISAVTMLTLCVDTRTATILKDLVISNQFYPHQYHKALAARAIAETGDESVLPNVIEYANFMLDDSLWRRGSGGGLAALEGVRGLKILAKKNDAANQALQHLAQTFVTDTASFYVYRDQSFGVFGESIIPALASVGREENVRLIEQLLPVGGREELVRQMISVLGETGDDKTLRFLEGFGSYPEETKQAIAQIKERRTAPK